MNQRWVSVATGFAVLVPASFVLGFLLMTSAARTQQPASPATSPPLKPAAGPPAKPAADSPVKSAVNRISKVTVYPDSALVTREVDVPAGAGTMELVVTPLPRQTVPNSLYSEGADGVRVLSTRFRTRAVKEDTHAEVRKLEEELNKLQAAQQKLQAELRAADQNFAMFGKLESFTAAGTQQATEKGNLNSDAAIKLTKFIMDGRGEKAREMFALQQQIHDATEQGQFLQRKLREVSAGSGKTEHDAVIVVEKPEAAGKVWVNYLVTAAAWRPQYKLRTGKEAKDPVQLEYLAAIVQQSGEDWRDVDLALSTAQPMLNATPPELKTLSVAVVERTEPDANLDRKPGVPNPPGGVQLGAVGVQLGAVGIQLGALGAANALGVPFPGRGPGGFGIGGMQSGGVNASGMPGANAALPPNAAAPFNGAIPNPRGLATAKELNDLSQQLRRQAQEEQNQQKETGANEIWNYAGALEQAGDLALSDEVSRQAAPAVRPRGGRREGPSVSYHLGAGMTLPSRTDEQVVEVARIQVTPEYFYKAVPILTPHVYREATLTNKSRYVLLPGEATMYSGADFVGRMNMPLVAVGEQFTVGFGIDTQLQVQRQLVEKSRTMQGGNQVLHYEYRILASSFKGERVRLQLWDRLPQSVNETMNVTLIKAAPDLSKEPIYLRESRPSNLLRWDIDLDPDSNGEKAKEVRYEFKLELDKQMTFGSFQSK